jgi:ATP-dependent RNA helicase RhlB
MAYERQKKQLSERPTDIVVATPGRLIDYMRGKEINLSKVEVLVIDEADRMLDMGFIPDVQRIVQGTPPKAERQTMFFSATMTPQVTRLACQWTRNPAVVDIEPEQVAVNTVNQVVYITTADEKFPLLYNLITTQNLERVIVFTNRRDQARKLTDRFKRYNISSSLLSGEVAQNQRIKTLEDFRAGKIRILVATDVAARGLHVEGVSHVVNFNLPHDAEDYVHRIGRTGRAGASGISVSFACEEESFYIPAIEKFLGHELHCEHPGEELITEPPPPQGRAEPRPQAARKRTPAPRPRRSESSSRRRPPKKEADTV